MKTFLLGIILVTILPASSLVAAGSLTPGEPFEVIGTHGKFDFIKIDSARRRLLACHTGNGSLDIIDVDSSKLIKSVATGAAQGVAIDDKNGCYFVSASKPPKLVIIDSAKLEVTGEVALPSPADLCAYSPHLNQVFVDNDKGPETWIIDVDTKTIVHSWTYVGSSGMEDIAFNPEGTVAVQNVKDTSKLIVLDYATFPFLAQKGPGIGSNPLQPISTLPAEKPHGLALLKDDTVLIAGGTGKLVLLNYKSGKVLASCEIAPRVDEIAYDPELNRVYCASGTGSLSVVSLEQGKLTLLETIPTSPGAHSIAVDPKMHTVWIAFAKDTKAYIQPFAAK